MVKCVDTYYFLGIGGIGMSALARYFAAKGCRVLGYDRTESPLTKELEAEGIAVQYDDSFEMLKGLDKAETIVVRTPAVPEDSLVYMWLREQGFVIKKGTLQKFLNANKDAKATIPKKPAASKPAARKSKNIAFSFLFPLMNLVQKPL